MSTLASLFLAVVEAVGPVGILLGGYAAMAGAMSVIYRDCRKDRQALWTHVRELEKRIGDRE